MVPCGQRTTPADGARPSTSVASSHEGSAGSVAGGEREKWEQGRTGRKESNTLHVVFHFPSNGNATATATSATTTAVAATTAAASAEMRLLWRADHRRPQAGRACYQGRVALPRCEGFLDEVQVWQRVSFSMWTRVTLTFSYVGQPPVNVVDWTLLGSVTPVKNWEQCDLCWTSLLCQWVWRQHVMS